MSPDFITTTAMVLALGFGVAFTYFGYAFVTQLTSLVGALGGALLGSALARTVVAPAVGVTSPNLLLVSLVGAIVGSIVGSSIARSTQRLAIVALCFALSSSVAYSMFGNPNFLDPVSVPSFGSGLGSPFFASIIVGGVVGVLVWQFYLPFLAAVTSLLGASILQQFVHHWSDLLPVFQSDVWATLGTNHVLWLLLVGTGVVYQYRRYRRRKSSRNRVRRIHRRLN